MRLDYFDFTYSFLKIYVCRELNRFIKTITVSLAGPLLVLVKVSIAFG